MLVSSVGDAVCCVLCFFNFLTTVWKVVSKAFVRGWIFNPVQSPGLIKFFSLKDGRLFPQNALRRLSGTGISPSPAALVVLSPSTPWAESELDSQWFSILAESRQLQFARCHAS